MNKEISIDGIYIGEKEPVYIIAEMSANHLMNYERAKEIIYKVKEAGANAVKLQTYTADTITIDCDRDEFKARGIWKGETLYSLYKKAYTPWEWQEDLYKYSRDLGLTCFSSPFDLTAVDFMDKIGMPAYKVASYEINDIPMIRAIAQKGKPIIISTGVAHLEDIERAVDVCIKAGNIDVILLKCTSAYPALYEDMNIKAIPLLKRTFDCIAGLSDHTLGDEVSLCSVALGANVIEKHVTLKRSDGGPDSAFSMEIDEFADMVRRIRNVEKALGKETLALTDRQEKARSGSRSLYVVNFINKGDRFTPDNVRSIRPANGMHTMFYDEVIGRTARYDIPGGTPLAWDMIE